MKAWYLSYECGLAYAVVWAEDEKQALEKLFTHVGSDYTNEENKEHWKVEEFKEDTYDGVLFFG